MRLLDVGCGWGGMVRHAATHYGVDAVGSPCPNGSTSGPPSAWPTRVWGPGRDPAPGLPRGRRRSVRRHQQHRHVRARGPRPHGGICLGPLQPAGTGGPALEPRHRPAWASLPRHTDGSGAGGVAAHGGRRGLRAPSKIHSPSWTATSSPTASCTRSAWWSRCSRTTASRCATSRACASTTPSPSASGWPTSIATGTRRCARSGPGAPGCGASTWPAQPSASNATTSRSTRCWRFAPTPVGPGCPAAGLRRGGALA